MTFPRGDRLSSAGCALSFVGGDSCLLLTPPQMAEPKPGPEQIWLHPFLLWSICALEMTAMALKLSPVPPPPPCAPPVAGSAQPVRGGICLGERATAKPLGIPGQSLAQGHGDFRRGQQHPPGSQPPLLVSRDPHPS